MDSGDKNGRKYAHQAWNRTDSTPPTAENETRDSITTALPLSDDRSGTGLGEGRNGRYCRRSLTPLLEEEFSLTVFFGRLNQYKRRRVRIPHTTHVLTDKQADRKLPLFFSLGIQSIDRSFHAPSLTYCVSIPGCDILPVMAFPSPEHPGALAGMRREKDG